MFSSLVFVTCHFPLFSSLVFFTCFSPLVFFTSFPYLFFLICFLHQFSSLGFFIYLGEVVLFTSRFASFLFTFYCVVAIAQQLKSRQVVVPACFFYTLESGSVFGIPYKLEVSAQVCNSWCALAQLVRAMSSAPLGALLQSLSSCGHGGDGRVRSQDGRGSTPPPPPPPPPQQLASVAASAASRSVPPTPDYYYYITTTTIITTSYY